MTDLIGTDKAAPGRSGRGALKAKQARRVAASMAPPPDRRTPADRYEELFTAVQRNAIFEDSKTFVDCAPLSEPRAILAAYRRQRRHNSFDLSAFVRANFRVEPHLGNRYRSKPGESIQQHIDALWDELVRRPAHHPRRGSLLQLPHEYVVPGDRFIELYYWDSYFTMLGLVGHQREVLLQSMTDNFAYLIDTYGHVPNGTRTYYLSRSQPPVFALMAELCESCGGQPAVRYLTQLKAEHAFWMSGEPDLKPGAAHRRVVALPDGARLNRYWDDRDTPREESWREDVATAAVGTRPVSEVYRDIRAAAESGWDFSSRWLDQQPPAAMRDLVLSTIRTTRILPVELNALLHKLDATIARLSATADRRADSKRYRGYAQRRKEAMDRYLWNASAGAFLDYDWERAEPRFELNAATVAPLFTHTATEPQAEAVAIALRNHLLAPGGLATTTCASGEQWDRPNGWAPLRWMAVYGLRVYGHAELAQEIRDRWLRTVEDVFKSEGKLVEKYALREVAHGASSGGGGGEYPLQDGFGWTNGVVSRWLAERDAR